MSIRPVINNQPIFWVWGHGLKAGDVVSLDWSDDGHRTWHPCHATVAKGHTSVTTKAVNQVPGRSFRPCVKHAGHSWQCAAWMSAL
ncbi:hypothetical protein [Actinocrispum sp. NPDC049592]|uniref:hypothetical protein n=1 Tax=Actinocrispum sp. NPDC049592 TaxID=3154835 RepID=UPI00343205C8